MFFSGSLEIDPTQMTIIKNVKPSKIFERLLSVLTFGQSSSKQEHETFTAVSILQQINMGLRSVKIKNVIRLAVDDYDFYLDEEGVDDDLGQALFEFKASADPLESELFNTIFLVLEHIDETFKYLIEISVNRKHKVGEYPITVKVNAVMIDFQLLPEESMEELEIRIKDYFRNPDTYKINLTAHKKKFTEFMATLETGLKKYIRVDNVKKKMDVCIVRPKDVIASPVQIKKNKNADPVFYGYYGMDDNIFYTMLWSGVMCRNNIFCSELFFYDDMGNPIFSVGEQGFYAGQSNTLNSGAKFEAPIGGDITYYSGSQFEDELTQLSFANLSTQVVSDDSEDEWLDQDLDETVGDK